MKLEEIRFNKPVKVLQVFRNINYYGKDDKSFEERKDAMTWKAILSKSGFVNQQELYLPEQILTNPDLKTCQVITIEDDNQPHIFTTNSLQYRKVIGQRYIPDYNHCFNLVHPQALDIFQIKEDENIELYLKYEYFGVGIPKRDNIKLCDIKINKPVEVRINGKTDFSSSSGRARVFKEQSYIIEYIGDFDRCKILKEPYERVLKEVPTERKIVDLIKPLW